MTAKRKKKGWSAEVTRQGSALILEPGVFTWPDARCIALSLKGSAIRSRTRKGTPLQSAMSMLNFFLNRAGKTLPPERREVLQQAKEELRKAFAKEASPRAAPRSP